MNNKTIQKGRRKSLNDVRAPMMMLYVVAFCGGNMSAIPHWALLLFVSAALLGIALLFERHTVLKMMKWHLKGVLFGLALAVLLYLTMSWSMQFVTSMLIERGALGQGSAVPGPIRMLLEIRYHVDQISPALAGVLGALLLAPAEAIFWRGFIQTRLTALAGAYLGILLTAVLYAIFFTILVNIVAAIAAFLCGLAFSILTRRTNSLIPAAISHGFLWLFGIWLLPLY